MTATNYSSIFKTGFRQLPPKAPAATDSRKHLLGRATERFIMTVMEQADVVLGGMTLWHHGD